MRNIRKFILLVSCILPLIGSGQDWQCYPDNKVITYTDSAGNFRAACLDSIVRQDGFSFHFNFNSLNKNGIWASEYCYVVGPSWIGKYMLSDSLGNNYFFNRFNDTIRVWTSAALNESWIITPKAGDTIVMGTLSDTGIDFVFGLPDSTKTISFQMCNDNGDTINHPINLVTLKLSKHHGLLSSLDFYSLLTSSGDGLITYQLAGISNPLAGLQNLTWREVYNYNPGDIFHILSINSGHIWYYDNEKSINQVLEANWYPSMDSVTYRIARLRNYSGYRESASTPQTEIDTMIVTYSIRDGEKIDSYPEETFYPPGNSWTNAQSLQQLISKIYNSRLEKVWQAKTYNNGCLVLAPWNRVTEYYIEGCGNYFEWTYTEDFYHWYSGRLDLVYFKKGSETWGTPFDTTTWDVPEKLSGDSLDNHLRIFPNPVNETVTLLASCEKRADLKMVVFSLAGMKVGEYSIKTGKQSLSLANYKAGIYFAKLYQNGKMVGYQKIVKY